MPCVSVLPESTVSWRYGSSVQFDQVKANTARARFGDNSLLGMCPVCDTGWQPSTTISSNLVWCSSGVMPPYKLLGSCNLPAHPLHNGTECGNKIISKMVEKIAKNGLKNCLQQLFSKIAKCGKNFVKMTLKKQLCKGGAAEHLWRHKPGEG